MAKTPLYTALQEHLGKKRASFHTPGHKGRFLPHDLYELDLTELPDTDSLFEADGCIDAAEKAARELFHSQATFFSAGGCTLCIQAMFRLAAPQGGKVISSRVIHRSAVNTMALLGIEPVWVRPRPDAGPCLAGRLHPEDVKKALEQNPDAKAVYVTSPDYYGVLADIQGLSAVCHAYDVPLLVDNAHGTHLALLGKHPLALGADLTACSAHKTLPVLTGGAFLNVGDTEISRKLDFAGRAKEAMALFGSTSPGYPIMASLDLARAWAMEQGQEVWEELAIRMAKIKETARKKGLLLPAGETDPTRLAIGTLPVGMTGEEAGDFFRKKGVEPEHEDGAYLVCIATPFNTKEELDRLEETVLALPEANMSIKETPALPPLPPVRMMPREAVLAFQKSVPLEDAVGKIAGEAACPCPPGVPIVMPGEEITPEAILFLNNYGLRSIQIILQKQKKKIKKSLDKL